MENLRRNFLNPPAAFSPMPFYFLNGDLKKEEIRRQMADFLLKGVKGLVLHPRMGIPKEIGYLSDRFMDLIRFAVDTAEELGMLVILYDEGMYPSGSAHGMVAGENPLYASRGIFLREESGLVSLNSTCRLIARLALVKTGEEAYDPAAVRILQNSEQPLHHETAVCIIEDETGGTIRGIHPGEDDGQENAPRSADLLNPDAVACFIRLTHERYYDVLDRHFGKTVIAMFTDEPCPLGRNPRPFAKAWTGGLEAAWEARGLSLSDLPALWLDAGEKTQFVRDAYSSIISDRLGEVFYRQLSDWCGAHGILLAGHPANPDDMAMERYFGIPGQDVVWRFVSPENGRGVYGRESTQAKCASDSARHLKKLRNSNECFGCCGPDGHHWAMTVDDIKWYLNWLFVRGTNMIFPHAFFYSVDMPLRFLERPPDVGPNNYWWPYAGILNAYISRMCALLTGGVNQARVAVLCTGTRLPWRLPALLYERQIEFNYLEDSQLANAVVDDGMIRVADQAYSLVAVEDASLVNGDVYNILSRFTKVGGRLAVLNGPGYESLKTLAEGIAALVRPTVTLLPSCKDIRATQLLHGTNHLFLLTNEGEEPWEGTLSLPVEGDIERWDPWTGTMMQYVSCGENLPLKLNRRASAVFVTDQKPAKPVIPPPPPLPALTLLSTDIRWTATAKDGVRRTLNALSDWQTWEGMALYSGTVIYEGEFELENVPGTVWLDLGDVREMAVVSLNSFEALPLIIRPFELDVTGMLIQGLNRLRVEVTSCFVSRYEQIPWPCGLLGPVRVLCSQE